MPNTDLIVANTPKSNNIQKVLHKTASKELAIREKSGYNSDYINHFTIAETKLIGSYLKERDRLLIYLLVDGCLRVSEAIKVKPCDIKRADPPFTGWQVKVYGKGKKYRYVAVSASLITILYAYIGKSQIKSEELVFPISRVQVWRIMKAGMDKAGISKPPRVGRVHALRHLGAIEKLEKTGNLGAVQRQLGHSTPTMTMHYATTIQTKNDIETLGKVDNQWE
ncbi:MAG: site-specific integrase [Dehalococcoidia bacterium]|nr:site-specific integrase [Dehalococcoidia bacterium]